MDEQLKEAKCFFDIRIGHQDVGRIVFKLFYEQCPKTCENFRCLCTGERGISEHTKKPFHFKQTVFHRVVKNFMIQGGDIEHGDGRGGDSIYGGCFDDENLALAHDEPYLLSMANRGPNTNKSQFFITTNEAPHLDGKHVVFGRVVSGLDAILKIEKQEVDSKSRPRKKVYIADCGCVLPEEKPPGHNNSSKVEQQQDAKPSSPANSTGRNSRRIDSRSFSSSTRSSHSSSHLSVSSRNSTSRSCNSSSSTSGSCQSDSCDSESESTNSCGSSGSSSDGSCSSSTKQRGRKRQKTNPRLENNREIESNQAKKDEPDNPNYKCSVNLDEIPEVPKNRFLMRELPSTRKSSISSERESDVKENLDKPAKVDLSKFIDIDDGEEEGNKPTQSSSTEIRSQIKQTEPIVSRSGRIMRGRGSFKFRTPSPESKSAGRRDSYKSSSEFDRYPQNKRSFKQHRERLRYRSRSKSPRRR